MYKLISLITVFLIIFSCSQQKTKLLEQRISNIENGLLEFTSPMGLFQADSVDPGDLKTLAERMEHYNVPGVSIAVINDFALEWAKAYGILKAGSDAPVSTGSYFQAASTSKLVTAAIVLHYVEEGTLNLDEDGYKLIISEFKYILS